MWGHRCCQSLLDLQHLLVGHKQPQHASDLIPLHIKSELTSPFFFFFYAGVDGETNLVSLVTALQHQPWQMHHVLIRLKTKERTEGLNVCPAWALEGLHAYSALDFYTGLYVFLCGNTCSESSVLTLLSLLRDLNAHRLWDAVVTPDWFIGSLGWTQ